MSSFLFELDTKSFSHRSQAPPTELSAAVVEGPADPDHVGVGLAAGQVLHGDFFVYLEEERKRTMRRLLFSYNLLPLLLSEPENYS